MAARQIHPPGWDQGTRKGVPPFPLSRIFLALFTFYDYCIMEMP